MELIGNPVNLIQKPMELIGNPYILIGNPYNLIGNYTSQITLKPTPNELINYRGRVVLYT